ncbi:plasmid replication protein RepC [Tardiphaga sp.]|jgi:replication initiation protein RepC|uniref:plasmid replication protein RepC n=1 Tax=Tardiphaga sp. TaxID=1926292 RepID=UPI0037D9DCDD
MTESYPTTPFGRRTLTLAMVASQANARACPNDKVVHKWKTFRSITDAKDRLHISDRALTVLNALLTCLPDTALTPGKDLIVFPSNMSLSERTHGMAGTTLRRHLFALVSAGLIIRRDSPNGKRYARRSMDGSIDRAYGFDLTPIVARADEFECLAEEVRLERRRAGLARERITILRRDIAKMIAIAVEEGAPGDWRLHQVRFSALSGRLPRMVSAEALEPLAVQLEALAIEVGKLLESHLSAQKTDGNDHHSGAQYQNSNTEPLTELEPAPQKKRGQTSSEPRSPSGVGDTKPVTFPLGFVLKACPDIAMYARSGISNWGDLVATASLVRSALGISPSAWEEAVEAMGEGDASITIAAILQRSDEIKSPGGYLRGLTMKARAGQYSIGPVVMALWRKYSTQSGRATG